MPADGSAPPKVIAYVYGGQGTINVAVMVAGWLACGRS